MPIPARAKGPILPGWQTLRLDSPAELAQHFGGAGNIGLILGECSAGGLVDVDLDCQEALTLAAEYLPATAAVSGRPGNPRSHYWYIAAEAKTRKRSDPKTRDMICELRSTGCQTVVGPSIHPSGEPYDLLTGEPARVSAAMLTACVDALADAVIKQRYGEAALSPATAAPSVASANLAALVYPSADDRHDAGDVMRRASRYVASTPPAISGQGGHNTTYALATALVWGFGLDEAAALRLLLTEYSPRCVPPWGESDLRHKVADALTKEHANPRGWLRDKPLEQPMPTRIDPSPPLANWPGLIAGLCSGEPFPVDALPEPLAGFVAAGAKSIVCDPSYIALPLLAGLASAIGTTRCLELKRGWGAPAILWTVIVGESGSSKTPAFNLALKPIFDRQQAAIKANDGADKQYAIDLAIYEKAMRNWSRAKDGSLPPAEPIKPLPARMLVSDTTVEGLAPILRDNPRGVLMMRDELSGWLGSFDRYAKGKSDSAHWLSMHSGARMVVDRKTGPTRSIIVPRAAVSVCGGIQPGIFSRALSKEHRESGLAARLLLSSPDRIPKVWTESDIDPAAEAQLSRIFERLYSLEPGVNDNGEWVPIHVKMTTNAKAEWIAYYNEHGAEQMQLTGELLSAFSKLEEYAARFALVLHFARWAAGDPTLLYDDFVDVPSMRGGIRLAQWFKAEAARMYAGVDEMASTDELNKLAQWIESRGGQASAREVGKNGPHEFRRPGKADLALSGLVKAGRGQWRKLESGKGRIFELAPTISA